MLYAKENLQRINDYDFNRMVEHFQLKEALSKEKRKRFKNIIELNRNYLSQVDTMRNTIKNEEMKKIEKTKKEIEEKEQRHATSRQMYRTKSEGFYLNPKEKRISLKEKTKRNLSNNLERWEIKRLEEAKRTQNRLRGFSEKSDEYKNRKQKRFELKVKQVNENHIKNVQMRNELNDIIFKQNEQKASLKYSDHFWKQKERNLQKKEDKQKYEQRHLDMVKEIREQNEQERIDKQNQYIKKLDRMTNKKKIIDQKKKMEYANFLRTQNEKFENVKRNLIKSREKSFQAREEILRLQRETYAKYLNRTFYYRSRSVCMKGNNSVKHQQNVEKKITDFYKELNKIKDKSIMKKSYEQRRRIYYDILKEEADRKKREEEEKLLAMQK